MGSAGIRFILGLLLHQGLLQLSVYGNIKLETEYDPGYRFVAGGDGECTFKVRAASDVAIEFSADQAQTKQVLEILLGGANNMRSQIRSKAGELVEKQTPAILNAKEYRSFWIRWNDHAVTVGKQGSNEPIMTYQVDKISPMTVISIGADGSATSGSWVIDKPATQSSATTQKPKANEKPTTTKKPATAAPTRKTPPPCAHSRHLALTHRSLCQ
uniref:Putative farnesoic acid 0-methyl transferase n=2 Tax=Anopheles triannulatus TaxID=58253 RepID=A0A2M3ZY10_9DIPT